MIREHDFPRSIPLSSRARGWLVSEVTSWLESRAAQRELADA
jgi:predicted DNA-binding transcriptional regulator AlpA